MNNSKVYIILVNYKGWYDTIECVESLLKLNYLNFQIIIVDNDSPNESSYYIKKFLEGKLESWVNPKNPLRNLSFPKSKKPLPFVFYEEEEINAGILKEKDNENPIIFIKASKNRGFAAGNNIAIKYALKKNDFEYLWILNNDTVVDKNSLGELVKKIKTDSKIGIVSSRVMEYYFPNKIQSVGGLYNPILATIKYPKSCKEAKDSKFRIYYPYGASMLVKKAFIKDVGLMNEEYFLYFEELDWVVRGKRKGWKVSCAEKSVVYHKEGSSIGTNKETKKRSKISEYYGLKNRINFTKKYYNKYLIMIYFSFFGVLLNRLIRKDYDKLSIVFKAIFGKKIN